MSERDPPSYVAGMIHFKRGARSERNGRRFQKELVFWLSAAVLGMSFTFGGATRQGLVSEAIPELLSLPLLALALPRAMPFLKRFPSASALVIGVILVPCVQLVPLPPALWSVLPGRSVIAEILTVAQAPMSWRPISLIPVETSRALLSLLPAVAIFLATLTLERDARQRLLIFAVMMGVASALLAMLQVLFGSQIGLYFYDFTNGGKGVGFFANANHFGAFECVLLPLGAAALAETRARSAAFLTVTVGCIGPALMFALALTGSRSAIILGSLSAVATLVFVLTPERSIIGPRRGLALAAVFALTLLPVAIGLGLLQILSRFAEQSVIEDARWRISASAWIGLWSFFPVGAGIGTFESVYPLHERVTDLIWQRVNRAHNDALETIFEGGAISLILVLVFVGWLVNSTYCAFVRQDAIQGRYARAGAIALWLLLVHSLWDYPLRTIALEALFSLCLALQFDPPDPRMRRPRSGAGAHHLKRHSSSQETLRSSIVPRTRRSIASAPETVSNSPIDGLLASLNMLRLRTGRSSVMRPNRNVPGQKKTRYAYENAAILFLRERRWRECCEQ
jgi:O-antigen ligase